MDGEKAMTRRVSIKEAAEILGVSRKAVERRIHSGELDATKEGRLYIVSLPDGYKIEKKDRTAKDTVATETKLAAALAELEAVKGERDRLIGQLGDASRRLEDASLQVSQLTATVFQMSQNQKLLAERAESTRRSWLDRILGRGEERAEDAAV